jgi:hypothetical protein
MLCWCLACAAFHPTALPYAYAPGHGLPYATRVPPELNTTCNKNTAIAFAGYTFVKLVKATPLVTNIGQVCNTLIWVMGQSWYAPHPLVSQQLWR